MSTLGGTTTPLPQHHQLLHQMMMMMMSHLLCTNMVLTTTATPTAAMTTTSPSPSLRGSRRLATKIANECEGADEAQILLHSTDPNSDRNFSDKYQLLRANADEAKAKLIAENHTIHKQTPKNKRLGEPSIKWKVVKESTPEEEGGEHTRIGVRGFNFMIFNDDYREAFSGQKYDFPYLKLIREL